MMEFINKKDAIANGLMRYYEGLPCQNGHTSGRYTKNDVCVGCATGRSLKFGWRKRTERMWLEVQVPKVMTDERRNALSDYLLNQCVPAFMAAEVKSTP